jgi:hypothetical protein
MVSWMSFLLEMMVTHEAVPGFCMVEWVDNYFLEDHRIVVVVVQSWVHVKVEQRWLLGLPWRMRVVAQSTQLMNTTLQK